MVKVLNLRTNEEQLYSCSPIQAVISAYALEKGLATQLATGNIYNMDLPILKGKGTVSCGDWCARLD